jgi:fructose-1,6-bisphosphatase I
MYPPTQRHAQGKLRMLYEVNPMAFLAEQAGGFALDGCRRILDITPSDIHQRSPLIVGSKFEMQKFEPHRQELARQELLTV